MIKKILLYLIRTFHVLLCIAALLAPYLTNNKLYLSIFIIYYIGVVTLWHIFGKCFLNDIENSLDIKGASNNSYITNLFSNILGSHTKILFSLIPMINTFVCLYKINF